MFKQKNINAAPPIHVGIIMDGNGRWAQKRGLPRNIGHKQGASAFTKIVRHASAQGIKYLTAYAFSTENWSRPPEEIEFIMNLLRDLMDDASKYKDENIILRIIGDKHPLDADLKKKIADIEEESRDNTGMTLNIAINYGGRDELLHAAKHLIHLYEQGIIQNIDDIDKSMLEQGLYTSGMPDADLIIRTSGEIRISNFLLWQSAYAEYIFTDVLWPDFTPRHFDKALAEYSMRSRRMGGI